jgi:signal transduction histidine kinase
VRSYGFVSTGAVQAARAHRQRACRRLGVEDVEGDPAWHRAVVWLAIQAVTGFPGTLVVWALKLTVVAGLLAPLVWWVLPAGETFEFFVPVDSWTRALTVPPLVAAVALATLRWGVPPVARCYARACRAVLAPDSTALLGARVRELSTSRAEALDAHAAELRRIERDLHDGAQARLVAITIQLGVAQRRPHLADELIEKARAGAEQALVELRAVARSAYPPILADRGLHGAVHALVGDCPVPLRLRAEPLDRLPAAVEGAAYFVIAEALANVARHSNATGGTVELGLTGDRLLLSVTDDGVGGAAEGRGTGLAGIRRRITALDGRVTVTSPPGGPTTLHAELPCAW